MVYFVSLILSLLWLIAFSMMGDHDIISERSKVVGYTVGGIWFFITPVIALNKLLFHTALL